MRWRALLRMRIFKYHSYIVSLHHHLRSGERVLTLQPLSVVWITHLSEPLGLWLRLLKIACERTTLDLLQLACTGRLQDHKLIAHQVRFKLKIHLRLNFVLFQLRPILHLLLTQLVLALHQAVQQPLSQSLLLTPVVSRGRSVRVVHAVQVREKMLEQFFWHSHRSETHLSYLLRLSFTSLVLHWPSHYVVRLQISLSDRLIFWCLWVVLILLNDQLHRLSEKAIKLLLLFEHQIALIILIFVSLPLFFFVIVITTSILFILVVIIASFILVLLV